VAWLVQVVAPLCIATYLTVVRRRAGGSHLWRHALGLLVIVAVYSVWQGDLMYHYAGPLRADGVSAFPFFPLAVVVIAAMVQILPPQRVRIALCIILSAIVGSITAALGMWIS